MRLLQPLPSCFGGCIKSENIATAKQKSDVIYNTYFYHTILSRAEQSELILKIRWIKKATVKTERYNS